MPKHLSRLWLVVLAVAWAFDLLFWKQTPGISFAIFVELCLLAGFALAGSESLRPARSSLLILLPLAFFAVFTFVRLEPMTVIVSIMAVLALMALLAYTFLGGRWMHFGLVDHLWGLVTLAGSALSRGLITWIQARQPVVDVDENPSSAKKAWSRSAPYLRGVLIALPILILFTALFASADLVFSRYLKDFLDIFRIEKLPEYIFRLFYILILAYLLAGVYLHALYASDNRKLIGYDKPLIPPFFGMTEASIVLGGVILLFALFVAIQFRYLFGGQANINLEGFTYSEYARRGFAELIIVAFVSLLLYLGLGTIVDRKTPRQRRIFSALGVALLLLVIIILISAYQRLVLYEQAYGFSRLRTYTHVFMVWLGILFLALIGLELGNRLRYFWLAAILAALGFGITLNVLNVDSFIVTQNVSLAVQGEELDTDYLNTLSFDTTPTLIEFHKSSDLPQELKDQVGGVLACQSKHIQSSPPRDTWQSFHIGFYRADQMLQDYQPQLASYPLSQDENGNWSARINGVEQPCGWWGGD